MARQYRFLSGSTVFRRKDPENPAMGEVQPNFYVDYSKQKAVFPKGFVKQLGTSTEVACTTTNRSGTASMAIVGKGSPDSNDRGGKF